MAASLFRCFGAGALVGAALVAAPDRAVAQSAVRVSAVVSAPQTYEIRRDTAVTTRAPRATDTRSLRLGEGLLLNVQGGAGSAVRAQPSDSTRTVRLTIDYVAS